MVGYRRDRLVNAATIIVTGQDRGLDPWTITVSVTTTMGESSLPNLDRGDDVGPDSRGLFQQRVFEDLARVQVLTGNLGGRDTDLIEAELEQFGDLDLLPRPWDPPTCTPGIRRPLWSWLDDVAAWVNRGYAWKIDRIIPPCWPQHPHLAHELAVLACLRHQAGRAFSPDPLECLAPGLVEARN